MSEGNTLVEHKKIKKYKKAHKNSYSKFWKNEYQENILKRSKLEFTHFIGTKNNNFKI